MPISTDTQNQGQNRIGDMQGHIILLICQQPWPIAVKSIYSNHGMRIYLHQLMKENSCANVHHSIYGFSA